MFTTFCSSITKRFSSVFSISSRMSVPVSASRVLSVCSPTHCSSSKVLFSFHTALMRSASLCSVHSMTAATSLHSFYDRSAAGRTASVPQRWSSWPVTGTMQRFRRRSTSAAPDAFPKRVTRRTKKKEIEHRGHVSVALITFVAVISLIRTLCHFFFGRYLTEICTRLH